MIKNLALLFFSLKHLNCCSVFSCDFFTIFFKIIFVDFFLNIELVNNYNYNKFKSYEERVVVFLTKHCGLLQYFSKWFFSLFYWEKHYSFLTKHCQLLQRFFSWVFFPSKTIFFGFFFNIKLVENFSFVFFCFLLTEKLNHVAKSLYLSLQNTVDCYINHFVQSLSFWSPTQLFFSVMKYLLHHTFNFYYLFSASSQL
jgi:hypothetical protein